MSAEIKIQTDNYQRIEKGFKLKKELDFLYALP